MKYFAKPAVAIAFGAFFLCAETCLHADSVLQFARQPLARVSQEPVPAT
jgi:hypothetical protein